MKIKRRYFITCEFDEDDFDLVKDFGFDFSKNAAMRLEEMVRDAAKAIKTCEFERSRFAQDYAEYRAMLAMEGLAGDVETDSYGHVVGPSEKYVELANKFAHNYLLKGCPEVKGRPRK